MLEANPISVLLCLISFIIVGISIISQEKRPKRKTIYFIIYFLLSFIYFVYFFWLLLRN